MNTKRNVFLLAITLVAGCASAPPSGSSLQDTKELLASPEAEELQHEYPRLFEDANEALQNAEKAEKEGNFTDRDLYNTIANSKFESARNLSRANEYQARRSAMSNATYSLTNELADVKQEQLVVERYKQLDDRFNQATQRLEDYKGDEQKARAAIARARRLQNRAIYVGASNSTPTLYGQGEQYIESSLAQLEKGNPKAAQVLAKRAYNTFDQAIEKSETTPLAQRRDGELKQEEKKKKDGRANAEKLAAQKAIDEAVTARSKALEVGADSKQSNLFTAADYRLDQARTSLANGRFPRAIQLADRAADAYNEALEGANKVTVENKKVAEKVIVDNKTVDDDQSFFSAAERVKQAKKEEKEKEVVAKKEEKPSKQEQEKKAARDEEESYDLLAKLVKEAQENNAEAAKRREEAQAALDKQQAEQERFYAGLRQKPPVVASGDLPDVNASARQQQPLPQPQQPAPYPYQGYPYAGGYPQPYMPPAPYPVPYPVPVYQQPYALYPQQMGYPGYPPGPYAQPQQYPQQAPQPSPAPAQVASQGDAALRSKVVEKLSDLQLRRAELGHSVRSACSEDALEEFDGILSIAKDRLSTNDFAIALEFLTRADERLRNCRTATDQPLEPLADIAAPAPRQRSRQRQAPVQPQIVIDENIEETAPAPQKAEKQTASQEALQKTEDQIDALEKSARRAAVEALNNAKIDLARARTKLQKNPTRIKSSELLLQRAQDEYNNKQYAIATVSAMRASSVLKAPSSTPAPLQAQVAAPAPVQPTEIVEVQMPQQAAPAPVQPAPAVAAQVQSPAVSPSGKGVVKVEDATPQCQGNAALISVVREKQNQVATPENVNQLILAANDLNKSGSCKEAALFYQQALSRLYTIAAEAAAKPAPVAAQTQPPTNDNDALKNQATISVANAEEKRAAKARFESDPSYQVGLRLLSSARDRLREGNYPTALLFAKEAAGSFDNVVEQAPATPAPEPAKPAEPPVAAAAQQQPQGPNTAALDQDPRRFRREYNQVLDALVARDRARDRVSDASRETFDRGLDFLGKARRAWGAQDYQGAGRLAVEAKKEFDSIKAPAPKPPEPAPQPKVDDSAQKEKEAKKKQALDLLEAARKARRDCEAASCRSRDDRAFLDAVGRVVDAETAIATEQFDSTIAAANEALEKFKKLMALPKAIQPSSPYLSIQEDQLVLNPRITFETGSSNISGEAAASVQAAADFFKEFSDRILSISIAGYTDSIGNAGKNQRLSASRANAVAQALKAQGVNIKMNSVGYGENNPIASNKTADGRDQNRRVEIRFKTQE